MIINARSFKKGGFLTLFFIFIFVIVGFAFFRFTDFSVNNILAAAPGESCDVDDQCEWDIYGVGEEEATYPTFGEGTELWHREGKCISGVCELDPKSEGTILTDTNGNPADCSLLNEQICKGTDPEAAYYRYYAVSGDCCEISAEELKETCHGDNSFCTLDGSEAVCQSIPEATNLEVTNMEESDYCNASEPLSLWLSWNYSSDTGDAQEGTAIQARSGNNDFSDAAGNFIDYSENQAIKSYPIDVEFGKTYYWRVKVWDENNESSWSESSFQINEQRANVDFTWSPEHPFEDEEVTRFDNQTTPGAYEIVGYNWTFQNGTPATSTEENPEVIFEGIEEPQEVTLQVEENVNGTTESVCATVKVIEPRPELPDWEEADPFN